MSKHYDSVSPAGKLRGSADYLMDKYMALGQSTSDHILSQLYFQQAEHYRREMYYHNGR